MKSFRTACAFYTATTRGTNNRTAPGKKKETKLWAAVGVDVVIASVVRYSVGRSEIEESTNIVQTAERMRISVDVSIESGVMAYMCLKACAKSPNL